jgi:hypothetical protein
MGILEKLRPLPKWKHADPTVRAAAVYDIPPEYLDDLYLLAREDGEARVRRAAVTRIDDAAVLGEIAKTDPDEDVRAEAVRGLAGAAAEGDAEDALAAVRQLLTIGRLKELAVVARDSSSPEVRASVIDAVEDQKTLSAISRHAQDGQTRLRALQRLTSAEEILAVALKAEHTDAAIAALERVADASALATISLRARNKVAARRARARLRLAEEGVAATHDDGARMSADSRASALALVHSTEALVTVADPDEATAALAAARLAWAELQADLDVEPALLQQFDAASDAVREAVAQRQQDRAAEQERARAVAREQADRVAICDEIAALSGPEASDRVAELKVRWDALPSMPSEYAVSLSRRFQDACRAFDERERHRMLAAAASVRLDTLATELEQLTGSGQSAEDIVTRWRSLRRDAEVLRGHASANPAAAERLERAVTLLETQEQQVLDARTRLAQDNLRRLQQVCRQVETLASADRITLKAGDRALRDIRAALAARTPLPSKKDRQEAQARLEAARAALAPRVQELRDADEWQRWANVQVQEELCGHMEALTTESDPETALQRLRQLQARWKEVAVAPRAQGEVLWRRFKTAQDEVFRRAADYLAAQRAERALNLANKQALCERAEALAGSSEWVRTAAEIQTLQMKWKAIGPVTQGHERAVWERFRAACDRFFTRRQEDLKRRKESWSANLAKKEALCARAEAVSDSTDWEGTAAELRRLQAEWKTIGPVRKTKSEAVWQRFHAACDRFFERYKHRDQADLTAKAAPREAVIRDLETLVPPPDQEVVTAPDGLQLAVQDARNRWQQAPELPRHVQDALTTRYRRALTRVIAAWPAAFKGTELDPDATRKRMERLVARVEEFVAPAGGDSDMAVLSPAERLARQWRERLASNTITGGRAAEDDEARWRAAEQEVRSAQAQWLRLGPLPDEVARPLGERFQRACRRFYDQRKRAS